MIPQIHGERKLKARDLREFYLKKFTLLPHTREEQCLSAGREKKSPIVERVQILYNRSIPS